VKILIVDHYYDRFLGEFYRRHPEVHAMDYSRHLACLMAERFSTSDTYSWHFRQNGWEAEEIIANDGHLQAKWAKENGCRVLPLPNLAANALNLVFSRDWRFKVLLAQVRKAMPDVVLIQEQSILTDEVVEALKKISWLVVCQIASPLLKRRDYRHLDFILSCAPAIVRTFREQGLKVEHWNLGFDRRVLENLGPVEKKIDLSFVGGISRHHSNRILLLEALSSTFPLEWFGYGENLLKPSSPLKKCWMGSAWGLDVYRILAASRMTFNSHIGIAGEYANNMRLFEATGSGACLVTDWKKNLCDFFEPDKEVVTYGSEGELLEKIRFLREHPMECRSIGEAGQKRTLACHGYDARIRELIGILEGYL